MSNDDLQLLTPEQVAQLLGVTVRTLGQWRWKGVGPRFLKAGSAHRASAVRYRAVHVREWIDQQATGGGAPVKESA